jgi:hypothetical protein
VRRYFTLFFVPVIPLGTKYFTTCTMCGRVTSITKEGADQYMAAATRQAASNTGVPSPPPVGAGVAPLGAPHIAEGSFESSSSEPNESPSDT